MTKARSTRKRVLLFGINYSPELTGIGKYTGEMTEWLIENGYQCTVVTSFPYYPKWKIEKPYTGRSYKKEVCHDGNLTVYRCPIYVPGKPSGMKRILNDASFLISAFFVTLLLLFQRRHESIFCMAPPFLLGFLAFFYRFFKGGKVVYHIHDMQIEAARDLNVLNAPALFRLLFRIEHYILKNADYITTVSQGMLKRIIRKTSKDVVFFPNWADTVKIFPIKGDEKLKEKWGFEKDDKVVVYSGSIGEKQGLDSLLNIAAELQSKSEIRFIICGNGPYKDKLIEQAAKMSLKNMSFMPLVPMESFNSFLNMTDVHLVIQKRNACDLMMPSKLTTILAAGGLALATAEKGSTLESEISSHNMGHVIDCEDETILRNAIVSCCEGTFDQVKVNARLYAERFLDRDVILRRIMNMVEQGSELQEQAVDISLQI